ncbi:protein unc-93 homolog A-like [Mercenaria mercenaria]|uniref:protein unc-93 homolog A-like n=1 Tax=Mercenaria mercenaria TaxID=6596 RepID=UPI00234F14C6|nr:protein unc-93 homolog A-like [Mercenaria mercenaria]XP_053401424.1 protein unc-93 homolog A-like [Mercenaria mercenaria]XP_053401425.1 protein unc-93 homolog A-like [Mercenaria mercenaria]XP_053401427.1 protein unc-93 homolog A-like [Mercenaria mercenaria]XP_053401428.1 protein unc-93 homolog A-like [Mercenaria mercenaria]
MDNPGRNIDVESEKAREAEVGYGATGNGYKSSADSKLAMAETYKMTKFQVLKNLVVVSIAFLFLFTAFQSLSNLQSSLNREEGIGTVGLSVIYGALVISCMFLPPFIIDIIGCKWTVAFSMLCYILYMAANFYATWWTIIPSAIILGIGAAPLWSAKCTYLTQTGTWYSKMTGRTEDDIINRFFGVFFMIFQTSQIWGNLISSMVFSERGDNATTEVTEEALQKCGANNCPADDIGNNTNLKKPELKQVYTVCGIYIASAFVAFLIVALFLDKINLDKHDNRTGKRKLSFHLLLETFKHMWRNPYQKLLIPLTIYSGIEQAFIAGDFTRSYISCSIGIWNVGFVMICYGVVDAACSFTFGRLVQYVGHIPFFILAFAVHLACQITMLHWIPDPDKTFVFYILAALWGIGDAVIQTQINALYGFLFSDNPEAAFANYRLWESIGFIFAFGYSSFICTDIKLYICIAVLSVGMVLYACTEILHRKKNCQSVDITR